MHFNGIEYLILKWTFGAIFLGATLLFLAKIGILVCLAIQAKIQAVLHASPILERMLELLLEARDSK